MFMEVNSAANFSGNGHQSCMTVSGNSSGVPPNPGQYNGHLLSSPDSPGDLMLSSPSPMDGIVPASPLAFDDMLMYEQTALTSMEEDDLWYSVLFPASLSPDQNMAESAAIKLQQQIPTEGNVFSCSRTSSINSVHGISSSASSAHNTDDEDLDDIKQTMTVQDRRREAHTAAEQKRRNAIKRGYDELQNLVPTCQQQDGVGVQKLSRAAVLQKSVDYVQYLMQQKKKQEGELEDLRKEVMALEIMKANYEHLVKTHKNTPQQGQNQVSDEVKFQVLQEVMDSMFQSFNASISVANFAELSGSIFSWLEEHCKPQTLREVTLGILRQLNNQLNQ